MLAGWRYEVRPVQCQLLLRDRVTRKLQCPPSCLGTARWSGLGSEADGPRPIVELRGDAMTGTAPMTRFDEVIEHSITRVVMAVTTLN